MRRLEAIATEAPDPIIESPTARHSLRRMVRVLDGSAATPASIRRLHKPARRQPSPFRDQNLKVPAANSDHRYSGLNTGHAFTCEYTTFFPPPIVWPHHCQCGEPLQTAPRQVIVACLPHAEPRRQSLLSYQFQTHCPSHLW
jgi:hypothetical protein